MIQVTPRLGLVSKPMVDKVEVLNYLNRVGGAEWYDRVFVDNSSISDAEILVEFAGRICYRSWKEGLNPNVTRVRKESASYLRNILASLHGSVLEHAQFSFVVENFSRITTHELIRHRAGTAVSQESMRFVRLGEIPFWMPEWVEEEDSVLYHKCLEVVEYLEKHQQWMAARFRLDSADVAFSDKKVKTSFMRRFVPDGVATNMVWSANIRAIRHVIEMRTSPHAEEEIRILGDQLARIMVAECPLLFGDFKCEVDEWTPEYRKV